MGLCLLSVSLDPKRLEGGQRILILVIGKTQNLYKYLENPNKHTEES